MQNAYSIKPLFNSESPIHYCLSSSSSPSFVQISVRQHLLQNDFVLAVQTSLPASDLWSTRPKRFTRRMQWVSITRAGFPNTSHMFSSCSFRDAGELSYFYTFLTSTRLVCCGLPFASGEGFFVDVSTLMEPRISVPFLSGVYQPP